MTVVVCEYQYCAVGEDLVAVDRRASLGTEERFRQGTLQPRVDYGLS